MVVFIKRKLGSDLQTERCKVKIKQGVRRGSKNLETQATASKTNEASRACRQIVSHSPPKGATLLTTELRFLSPEPQDYAFLLPKLPSLQ